MRSVAARSGCSGTRWSATRPTRRCRRPSAAGWSARWPSVSTSARTGGWSGSRARRWIGGSARIARAGLTRWSRSRGGSRRARRPRCWSWRSRCKRERPARTAAQVHGIMLAAGERACRRLRTMQTHLARAGLNVRADGRSPGKVYGRFEAARAQRVVDRGRAARPDAGRRRGAPGGAAGVHRRPLAGCWSASGGAPARTCSGWRPRCARG